MKIHSSQYTITVDQNKIHTLITQLKKDEENGIWHKRGHASMDAYIDASCMALVSRWDLPAGSHHQVASAISNFIKEEFRNHNVADTILN